MDLRELRNIRLRRGLSQADLSAVTGVAEYTISEIEAGKRPNPRPSTLRKLAQGLDVEVAALYGEPEYPLGEAPPNLQPPLNGLLEEEWRAQHLGVWKNYLARRVEWCEKVLHKAPDEKYNNPFLALDTAIQWAIYVGIESTLLRNTIHTQVLPYADSGSDVGAELGALVGRFDAVSAETDARVKAMMDEAGLEEEEKEQIRLRLVHGSAA
jgi:transcriptional regulator with XRE-family HTH domain